tara:strand:+ start:1663 stop:1869 length:207 start_codon:yes stop_codon:yes gene_type:complete
MILLHYKSKKELKTKIGEKLKYTETSIFGPQYRSNGVIYGARRPHIEGGGREFFAEITMKNNRIFRVK